MPAKEDYTQKTSGILRLKTYRPRHGFGFNYSEKHCLYTNDIQAIGSIPTPTPPSTTKSDVYDSNTYRHVVENVKKCKDFDTDKPIHELIKALIEPAADDLSKLVTIFRWFTAHHTDGQSIQVGKTENSVIHHLHDLQKTTYAAVFSTFCWHISIPCVIIRGYLKGSNYSNGQTLTDGHKGEWNAVLVNGQWRFIDIFWCSYAIGGSQKDNFQCDESYFLMDPDQFIYTHFPETSAWQLLETPIDKQRFETNAFLKERCFELGMKLLEPKSCHIDCESDLEIRFELNSQISTSQEFKCIVTRTSDKDTKLKVSSKHIFIDKDEADQLSVKVRFMSKGRYKLEIIGKDSAITKPEYEFDWIAIFTANVKSVINDSTEWGPTDVLTDIGLSAYTHKTATISVYPGPLQLILQKTKDIRYSDFVYTLITMISNKDEDITEDERKPSDERDYENVHSDGEQIAGQQTSDMNTDDCCRNIETDSSAIREQNENGSDSFQNSEDTFETTPRQRKTQINTTNSENDLPYVMYTGKNNQMRAHYEFPAQSENHDHKDDIDNVQTNVQESETDKDLEINENNVTINEHKDDVTLQTETTNAQTIESNEHQLDINENAESGVGEMQERNITENALDINLVPETNQIDLMRQANKLFNQPVDICINTNDENDSLDLMNVNLPTKCTMLDQISETTPNQCEKFPTLSENREDCETDEVPLEPRNDEDNIAIVEDLVPIVMPIPESSIVTAAAITENSVIVDVDINVGEYQLTLCQVLWKDTKRSVCHYHIICKPQENKIDLMKCAQEKYVEDNSETVAEEDKDDTEGDISDEDKDSTNTSSGASVHSLSDTESDSSNNEDMYDQMTMSDEELLEFLRKAIAEANVSNLEKGVSLSRTMYCSEALKEEVLHASYIIWKFKSLKGLIQKVKALTIQQISEIRSYCNPPQEIHDVMKATLILLHHPLEETENWKFVQSIVGKTGKPSLKHRIEELDIDAISLKEVVNAEKHISSMTVESVYKISRGAVAFYLWSKGVVDAYNKKHRRVWSSATKRRHQKCQAKVPRLIVRKSATSVPRVLPTPNFEGYTDTPRPSTCPYTTKFIKFADSRCPTARSTRTVHSDY